ncbi:MAG: hypothetical protein J6Y25_06675 [Elusimicrobiaceae bacterium]|nr:hypothetical protein [Elusimicrobiaceae bacterium]
MKKILAALLLCVAFCAHAQTLTEAEKLYQDGDFASAQKQYEEIVKTATGNDLYQAQLRLAACQYSQGAYLNAAKTLFSFPLPQDALWKARFLLYRTQMAQQVANQYSPILQAREIEGNTDMEQWTRGQWHSQMQKDFEQLWALRADLIKAPIQQETLILNVKDTDTQRIPTLFDFVVQQWTSFLGGTEQNLPAEGVRNYLSGHAAPIAKQKNRADKLASVLKTAYELEGTNRQNARLFWQTDYILLPLQRKDLFEIKNEEKAFRTAVEQLYSVSGFQHDQGWWKKFKGRSTAYGQSYAAYQVAQLLLNHQEREQALAVCQYATKQFAESYYTQQCQDMAQEITKQAIYFVRGTESTILNPQQPKLSLETRNIPTVYVRVYPVTRTELETLYHRSYHRAIDDWTDLLDTSDEILKAMLSSTKKYQTVEVPVSYPKPYDSQTTFFTLPALEKGFYVVIASSNANFNYTQGPVSGQIINITDLALFTTAAIEDNPANYVRTLNTQSRTYKPQVFRWYALDLKTGEPQADTELDVIQNQTRKTRHRLTTNREGTAGLPVSILVEKWKHTWERVSTLAQKNGDSAIGSFASFDFSTEDPVKIFLQTDRAIYRPGQKVTGSVQAFQAMPRGWKVLPNLSVKITAHDTNGKQIYQANTHLNEWGTAQVQFSLPQGNELMGYFNLRANLEAGGQTYHAYHNFQVEEYKRPEYEISLNDPKTPLVYNQKGTVTGLAKTYAGTALQGATVKYTVKAQEYSPWFYSWRYRPHSTEVIAQGQTKTDSTGVFSISWTPQPTQKEEQATQYTVQAEVYDETGRPIETTRNYRVSAHANFLNVDFAQGFYDAHKSTPLGKITLADADGHATPGQVSLRIAQVENTPQTPQEQVRDGILLQPAQNNDINAWYKDAKELKTVYKQTLNFTQEAQEVQLPALEEGIYRLILQNEKAQKQEVIFVVVSEKSSLSLPAITLPQYNTYHPGETARVLLGAGSLANTKWVEVLYKRNFLRTRQRLPGGVSIYEYLVTEEDRGGIAINWFGASDYQIHQGATALTVPFDNQKLAVEINTPETVRPGQTVAWQLTARDYKGTPINGQASLAVYDKSLDYYAKKTNPFDLATLFPISSESREAAINRFIGYPDTLWDVSHVARKWVPLPNLPTFNLVMQRNYYRNMRKAGAAAPMMAAQKVALDDVKAASLTFGVAEVASRGGGMDLASFDEAVEEKESSEQQNTQELGEELPQDVLRTDFAETAYFNSLLPIKNGKALVSFTLPQSITTWNVLGFALTKDAELGTFTATAISRKEFMVRLHLPRFYRENDKGVFQASVINLSNRKITVPVTLSITQDKQGKAAAFGLKNATQNVTVEANSTAYASWEITAPTAPGLYQISAVARSVTSSDGEQKDFPVLPSLSRLLATTNTALKNGANTLTLTELNDVSDAQPELAALTLHPSLALSVLNKMPNLLVWPYNDLVSSLNRYVPLAIVHQFYTTYPELKQAVLKLPKRTGVTAAWNETDPLRLTVLEQTPWLNIAQGSTQHQANLINLFDDKIVSERLAKEKTRILKFQNPNGSFSWFAGGPADPYLTLRALEAFAQAVAFGAAVPKNEAENAIAYVVPQIEKQLLDDKTGSVSTVSYALYAAYTLSAFPAHWTQAAKARPYLKKWVDYADQQSRFMTPLGQIYAAAIYHRLGDDVKANAYLDKVLARMKYNPLTGAYFAPEAQSWLWYQDTLTTQTTTLKTLLEIRPDSDKIEPMVQWLLFNKQVTSWQNPSAAAQAVFALLDVMKAKGALTTQSTYQISWAGTRQARTFKPLDWTEDLQWVKQGAQVTPAAYRAQVTKQSKMTDFASLSVVYTSAQAQASPKGVLNVTREYFVRTPQGNTQKLRPLANLEEVKVGDEVEVQLTLTADSAFEYVLVSDPKPAGFESETLTSGWTWNPVPMYQEIRDAETNFFINRLPAGKVVLHYVLRPTVPGDFHAKPAQVQSLYAPEYGAHSAAEKVKVSK